MGSMPPFCLLMVIIATFATITVYVNANDNPALEIKPDLPVVTKQVGSSLALTCRPRVPEPNLVTQLEWRDPRGRLIENTNSDAPMHAEKLTNDPGLVLVFPKLQDNLGGVYTCRASYASTPLEATVKVVTIVDITWLDAPEYQYPIISNDYKVRCRVQANPAPIVDWVKNGLTLKSNDKYIVENDGLLIKNVKESDDGIYTCRAVVLESGSYDQKNIRVEVQIPPTIESIPSATVVEGESASVVCKAHSKPPSNYTWIKVDSREDLSKKDRFDVRPNTGEMFINRAEFNDNSVYKCIAENPAGRAELSVNITVRVKPRIFELINITAPIGNDTKIICKANGRPTPKVLFKKLSRTDLFQIGSQPFDDRILMENFHDNEKGETYGILTIRNLRRADDGLYECIADNEIDKAFKNGHIAVEFPPVFDNTLNIYEVWTWRDNPGNLTCVAESFPNATIKWRYNNIELDGKNPSIRIEGTGPKSQLIVTPGQQQKLYAHYECIATNRLGQSSALFSLKEAKVPDPILQVKVNMVTARTIKFEIVGPHHFTGMPLRTFICRYRRDDQPWDLARNKTWSVNAPYIIENLEPQRTYHFAFAAGNDVGIGGWNGPGVEYTMPTRSVPTEPKILVTPGDFGNVPFHEQVTVSPYADHYELRWNVPHDNGDPLDYYIIRYCKTDRINGEWRDSESECSSEITQPSQFQSYELSDLLPDTTYKIELRAHNAIGASSPAQIRVKTARGLDQIVQPHETTSISSLVIIGIVIGAIFLLLIIIDGLCFCINRAGLLAFCCECIRAKRIDEDDSKVSSYKAAPAHPNCLNLPQPIKLASTNEAEKEPLSPENREQQYNADPEKKTLMAEYDGKQVQMKSIEIGKYSAV
ncbi:fasciclin-2-like isoform X2 [Onthophagus taurus]|uniref:fasciclin-2-like isoform X2 n=1 Tax=Onthophagus taurus TaxID=166361 RepID=UPI000C20D853|nr:fasciclin-2-like isoform X2 [Onthophagus taurus]